MYGTTGREAVVQQQEEATAKVTTTQSARTLDGNPLYKGSDGLYYLDPEATQVVPADRVKDIK